MAFDKSKLPPGLLKEVPSKKGNENKKMALKRRLEKSPADNKDDNKRIRIG
jgi:hypothetical protein